MIGVQALIGALADYYSITITIVNGGLVITLFVCLSVRLGYHLPRYLEKLLTNFIEIWNDGVE